MRRILAFLLGVVLLWLAAPDLARSQPPSPGEALRGLEFLTPEERARVQENWERWKQLPPEERQRIRENLRRWREMTPQERQRLREELRARRQRPQPGQRPGDGTGKAPHPPPFPPPPPR